MRADYFEDAPLLIRLRAGFFALLGGLSGCAAIVEGSWQSVAINTEPSEARCVVSRDNATLGEIEKTPGKVMVTKNFSDLIIACQKAGYQDSLHVNKSEVAAAAILGILLVGTAAFDIDQQAGAIRKYSEAVVIPLVLPGEPAKPIRIVGRNPSDGSFRPTPAFAATPNPPPPPPPRQRPASVAENPAPAVAIAPPPIVVEVQPAAPIMVASNEPPPLTAAALRRLDNLKDIFDRKALTPGEYDRKRLALTNGR